MREEVRDPAAFKGVVLRDLRASTLDEERNPAAFKGVKLRDLRASTLDEFRDPGAFKVVELRELMSLASLLQDLRSSKPGDDLGSERGRGALEGVGLRDLGLSDDESTLLDVSLGFESDDASK